MGIACSETRAGTTNYRGAYCTANKAAHSPLPDTRLPLGGQAARDLNASSAHPTGAICRSGFVCFGLLAKIRCSPAAIGRRIRQPGLMPNSACAVHQATPIFDII